MPLLAFWKSAPAEVAKLTIEQVVSSAGDGVLKDNSSCCAELREYFSQTPSETIATYINHCLSVSFLKSGTVLQDLVNELGRRLGYEVANGRYQGTVNSIGFDGLWSSPEGHSIVLEVKTTDTYRISLDTIAEYRSKLIKSQQITERSSMLMVVGRNDTGDLEAQVRGSRHAWDIRLISADAILKLVQLRESTESLETDLKIRSILAPMEYTRLDNIIDIMFVAAADVEATTAASVVEPTEVEQTSGEHVQEKKGVWHFTDKTLLDQKRAQIILSFGKQSGITFIRKRGSYFWNAEHDKRMICTISKRYEGKNYPYWFGYHSDWHIFLMEEPEGNCSPHHGYGHVGSFG
jgi:hypothetical protein